LGSLGLGEGSNKLFFESEFESLVLKDQRLKPKALKIFTALMAKFTICIKNLFDNPQDQRQAYDSFVNSKVNNDHLIESHFRQTTDRINNNNDNLLLVIQDCTYLNFTNHKAKIDIGIVNSGEFGDVVARLLSIGFAPHLRDKYEQKLCYRSGLSCGVWEN
jgi:hypothetical protein